MKKTMIYSIFVLMLSASALTACSDEDFGPDAPKDWEGTTAFFNSADEAGFQTYYNPAIGRCGDPMPFYDEKAGDFKVLYLQEYDNNGACYHPFWGVSTKDGANYELVESPHSLHLTLFHLSTLLTTKRFAFSGFTPGTGRPVATVEAICLPSL